MKVVVASLAMAVVVFAIDRYVPFRAAIPRLICDLAAGGFAYLVLSFVFRTVRIPRKFRRKA